MIDISKLLKDAPKGMKLYSPLFGEVRLVCVTVDGNILVETESHDNRYFAYNGVFRMDGTYPNAECLLFPSNKVRTWVGWKAPVEPKFKVGDEIKTGNTIDTIAEVGYATRSYYCESGRTISFENQDLWHLSDSHYFKRYFKPQQWVLVRDCDNQTWGLSRFSHMDMGCYVCINREDFRQCIPFEGNEKLLGTTNACSDIYVNWN